MKPSILVVALWFALAGCSNPTASPSTASTSTVPGLTGVVTTLAGSDTSFNDPFGVATDGTNLYVADTFNNMIRKIDIATGVVSTLAGSTTNGSADGNSKAASFYNPQGVATDGTNL